MNSGKEKRIYENCTDNSRTMFPKFTNVDLS